jgi:hypothetical protein
MKLINLYQFIAYRLIEVGYSILNNSHKKEKNLNDNLVYLVNEYDFLSVAMLRWLLQVLSSGFQIKILFQYSIDPMRYKYAAHTVLPDLTIIIIAREKQKL